MLLAFFTLGCQRTIHEAEGVLPAIGDMLPAFSLVRVDGRRVTADELRGQPSVVALWSSTCGSSRAALAGIASLHRDFSERGVRVLVLADDVSADVVQAVLDSAAITVPVGIAAGQLDRIFAVTKHWPWQKGVALPSFLVVDSAGAVRSRVVGVEQDPALRMRRVRQAVAALLP